MGKFMYVLLVLAIQTTSATTVYSKIISVCSSGCDFMTIQNAIGDTNTLDGDEIIVYPGTYSGPINFLGKAITVISSSGPEVTTISGGGSVVTFNSGEGTGKHSGRVYHNRRER